MQKRRVTIVVVGAMLCLGAIAAAQDAPPVSAKADKVVREQSGRTTFTGNVVLTVDGAVVRADRAVIQGRDVTLEGNVRLTLPRPVYTAQATRDRIPARTVIVPAPYKLPSGPWLVDTPIPEPWQPPSRNQR